MKSCCKKLKIPVSPQEHVICLLNSIHIQSIATGIFFFWLPSKPTSAAKQTILYLHPGKHFKVFFNLQTTAQRCWLTSFPTAWQVGNAPRDKTNTQSCCVYGIHPSTLLLGRSRVYGQMKKPDHLHTDLKKFLLNSKVYLSCIWKWYQWEENILSLIASSNGSWIKWALFHCYKGVDMKQFKYLL